VIAFRDVRVFDGASFLEPTTVVVDGARIASIGERPPGDSEEIDGRGRTLLPGFIDCHVHLGFFEPRTVLQGGVTTVRDLGWPPDRIACGPGGPDLLFAGPMLTAPGGYPSRAAWAPGGTAREVRDAGEGRRAVAELAALGVAVVKVAQEPRAGPTLSPEVLGAICNEAHSRNLRVTSHCGSLDQLRTALDAGFDELAHGLWSDERIPDEAISEMLAAGIVVVPTLHVHPSPARIDNLRRFVAAGGRVVYGTDMGNPPVPPGIDAEELRLMRAAGLPNEHVLSSATALAAEYLGLSDCGRVAPGARADLVLAKGDLRDDLSVLARPVLVVRAGEIVR
jgi:imidazolonepropionase-like amidohydrolase